MNQPDSIDLGPLKTYLDQVSARGRTMLLPALHHAQSLYGWLPRIVQTEISQALRVPEADIHGVVNFYTMFFDEPTSKRVIRVCEDPACALAGSERIYQALQQATNGENDFSLETVTCLGMCELAPAALNGDQPVGRLTAGQVDELVADQLDSPETRIYGEPLWILERATHADPESLDDFIQYGGYQGLRNALKKTPEETIQHAEASSILGRGGAMFPLGRKWLFTRSANGTPENKHVVINADESEPGTFKDRYLLEGDPFAIIEGLTIAAYAVGAENGWIFLRGEYPLAARRMKNALNQAREAGYLGKNILGKEGFNLEIELRIGAGAYICGEETALFEAIEGKRGFPRIKPPFPTTNGLFNQPTVVNNVETIAAAAHVFRRGLAEWDQTGTERSRGTKLFCLSGNITNPGIYEVPFGKTIQEMIDLAGGVPGGVEIQTVLIGGAAGAFLSPDRLDARLTYEDAQEGGFPLGSGVIMVFDENADIKQALYQLSRFFAHESCGKCFPCQLGTQRQMEILHDMAFAPGVNGKYIPELKDIGLTMTQTSLCGLGQTAASALLSVIHEMPEKLQ